MVYATGGYTGGVASSSQKLFVSHMHRKPCHTWRATCNLYLDWHRQLPVSRRVCHGPWFKSATRFFFGLKVAYCKQQRHRCNGCRVIISKATADFKRITALTAPCCHLLTISSQPWLALYEMSIPAFLYTQIDSNATSCTANWQALNARSTCSTQFFHSKEKGREKKEATDSRPGWEHTKQTDRCLIFCQLCDVRDHPIATVTICSTAFGSYHPERPNAILCLLQTADCLTPFARDLHLLLCFLICPDCHSWLSWDGVHLTLHAVHAGKHDRSLACEHSAWSQPVHRPWAPACYLPAFCAASPLL